MDFVKIVMQWGRLGDLIRNTGGWAEEVYGWGSATSTFNYDAAIQNITSVIEATGLALSSYRELSLNEADAFLKNRDASLLIYEAAVPILQGTFDTVEPDGTPVFSDEAGLKIVPFGDLNQPQNLGLALTPYAKGQADGDFEITPNVDLSVKASAAATGGAVLVIQPDGVHVEGVADASASFDFGLRFGHDDHSEIILFGKADATRLALEGISATAGGALDGDLYIALGMEKLRLALDLSEDGFLGALLPEPITVDAGDLLVGWRAGRGVYFEGGTSLAVIIPLNLPLGPVNLFEIGVALDWSENLKVVFSLSGDARLGPMYASVEALGLVMRLVPSQNGVLGKYDLAFGIQPPTGYALALDGGVIQGGGRIDIYEHEYRGALALKFTSFSISAFAILTTQMPDGRTGFSFVASIFGQFTLPLGYNFYLTGVGGIIGLNRTTDTEALRVVLFAGRFDNLLFPQDPIANAATILDDMAAIFPVMEGQHLFGPVAKIAWGQPVMIEGKIGLVLEVGRNFRLLILGGLAIVLPVKDVALISLTLSFFGEIDFAAGTISFDASLQSSRILTWPVSGDAAFRTGWATGMNHVAAIGGMHPSYPKPTNLPNLRRLGINFGTNNPRVTIEAYAAVTLNSLQFGGRADLYAKGPDIPLVGQVAAEGWIYLNALVYFNPFSFDAELGGGLQLLVDGDIVAGLGFDLRLTGPNPFHIRGKVWVTVFGIDVEFQIRHKWGQEQQLPPVTADPVQALRQALVDSIFEPVVTPTRIQAVTFRSEEDNQPRMDPGNGARLVQRALPLGVTIQRVGEAQIAGSVNKLDLRIFAPDGTAIRTADTSLEFVRGHFWNQSESDRLRAPTMDRYKAGFEIGGSDLRIDPSRAVTSTYAYEFIQIALEDDRSPAAIHTPAGLDNRFAVRWMNAFFQDAAEPFEKYTGYPQPQAAPTVKTTGFAFGSVPASTQTGGAQAGRLSLNEARQAVQAQVEVAGGKLPAANPVVADYIAALSR